MKLRTTKNSIRIRVRKSELEILSNKKVIEEFINFPSGDSFKFSLSIVEANTDVNAMMSNGNLNVSIPLSQAKEWMNTNQVGIENKIKVNPDEELHILIEKDFPCKDRPEEDKSDTFTELANEQPPVC